MATRPPDWQIGPPRGRHRTLWSDLAGLWHRFRSLPILVQIIISVVAIVLLVDLLSITGTPEEAQQKLAAYGRHVDHIALHTPYVPPLTAEDAADGFANIIKTFGA